MVLSLAIVAVLLVASGSMMVVLAKSAPGAHTLSSKLSEASRVLERLVAELEESTRITTWAPDEVVFEVNDRDADTAIETVRYAWLGAPGTPGALVRQINGGREQVLLEDVHEFTLAYDIRSAQTTITTGETLLSAYTASALVSTQTLNKSSWPGQLFVPGLPGDATSWALTRFRFKATSAGPSSGEFSVQLRTVDGSLLPTTTIVDQVTVLESELPGSIGWHEVTFAGATGLSPSQGYCIVVEYVSGSNAGTLEFEQAGAGLTNEGLLQLDRGTWTLDQDASLTHEIFGSSTSPDPGAVAEDRLHRVNIVLNVGESESTRLRARANTLNSPITDGG